MAICPRSIASSLDCVLKRIERAAKQSGRDPREIQLVAVSKGVGRQGIDEACQVGITVFGENRVSEAINKFSPVVQEGVSIHLIGSLQTNKIRKVVGFFDVIHSIDSIHLAEKVALEAARQLIVQPVLVQVNVAQEAAKRGVSIEDAPSLVKGVREFSALRLLGLMTIPPLPVIPEDSRPYYSMLRGLGASLGLNRFSMGMSTDFEVAISEGATWVRIGTALFGPRDDAAIEG